MRPERIDVGISWLRCIVKEDDSGSTRKGVLFAWQRHRSPHPWKFWRMRVGTHLGEILDGKKWWKRPPGTGAVEIRRLSMNLEPHSITALVFYPTAVSEKGIASQENLVREGNLLRAKGCRLDLRDCGGRLVQRAYGSAGGAEIDISRLGDGTYLAICDGQTVQVVITLR